MTISVDTNILFASQNAEHVDYVAARAFVRRLGARSDVVISELVLVELYRLLRNPVVNSTPATATEAHDRCAAFRNRPGWRCVGFPPDSSGFHGQFWTRVREPGFPARRVFDLRLALSLLAFGVDEFATANIRDFEDIGFRRLWNPLRDS